MSFQEKVIGIRNGVLEKYSAEIAELNVRTGLSIDRNIENKKEPLEK